MTPSSLIEMEELAPKYLYLSPNCGKGECFTERTWCEDDQGPCDECGSPSVKYVKATARAREGWHDMSALPHDAQFHMRSHLETSTNYLAVLTQPNARPQDIIVERHWGGGVGGRYFVLPDAPPSTPERG